MNYNIQDICCFCLSISNEKCNDKSSECPDNLTPFNKIKTVLLELSAVMSIDSKICMACSKNVDFIYEFNKTCLRNINILNSYKKVLKENKLEKKFDLFINLDKWKQFKDKLVSEVEFVPSGSHLNTLCNTDFVSESHSSDVAEVKKEIQINYEKCDENSERLWLEPEIKIEIEESDVKQNRASEISEPSMVGPLNSTIKDFGKISVRSTEEVNVEENQELIKDPPQRVVEVKWYGSRIHTGEEPIKCHICNKLFNREADLKRHSSIHSDEKSHKCNICGKLFNQKYNVKKHMLIHTGEKSHKCEICGKLFTQKGDLKTHYLRHTGEKPHKCDICGKLFSQLGTLNTHKLIHTDEKPHECDVCRKLFRRKDDLKRHYLIHTGEKPHKCDICEKSFKRKEHLEKHLLMHKRKKLNN